MSSHSSSRWNRYYSKISANINFQKSLAIVLSLCLLIRFPITLIQSLKTSQKALIGDYSHGVCFTDNFLLLFLHFFKVWSMLHHGSVERVQSKERFFKLTYVLLAFFAIFHEKISVFIIFISFFDKVSNFHNKVLTIQKPELVMRNYETDELHACAR